MNFDDTPAEADFRGAARSWIEANAPHWLRTQLERAGFGSLVLDGANVYDESKAWQRAKYDAGWACLHWPREYGGRAASPIERVIWEQEEGAFARLSSIFGLGQGMCGLIGSGYPAAASQARGRRPRGRAGGGIRGLGKLLHVTCPAR